MYFKEGQDLENIVLSAPIGICILDAATLTGKIVNGKFMEIAGKSREAIIGQHYWDSFAEARPYYEDALNKVVATGEPFYADEVSLMLIRHGKEEMVFVTFVYSPVTNEDGSFDKVAVWVLENTSQVISRQKIEKANQELETSNRELKHSEARLTGVFEQATAGIMICNGRDLVIESVNNTMLKIISRNANIKGKRFADILPELKSQGFFDILEQVYTTGETFVANEAKVAIARNGQLLNGYFNFSYQAINDQDDQTTGILIVANDVTEQVVNRLEAERLGKQLRLAVEAARIGTWHIQPVTKELEYNTMLAWVFGYEGPDKMTYDEAIGQVTEEFREPILAAIEQAIADGGDYDITYSQYRFNDNQIIWLRSLGKITQDEYGEHTIFSGVVIDITAQVTARLAEQSSMDKLSVVNEDMEAANEELRSSNEELAETQRELEESLLDLTESKTLLKDSEERLQMLADNMSQLAWMTDETGYIFWYNKRWYDYTGTTFEEMQGWGWDKVQHPEYLDQVLKKWAANLKSGEIFEMTFPLKSKEGEFRWFLTRAVPLKDDSGTVIRWFGTNTDINEQKQDDQRKNDFIGMVSHELKTPLTSLTALIQVSNVKLKNNEDQFLSAAMAKADAQVKKMTRMINGFLNVSRLESGKIHIERQRFDMKDLVKEIEEEIVPVTISHHIIFEPVLSTWVNGDKDKLGQVITNFISNALKYSPPGTTIQIACVAGDGCSKVSVRDEGMGIAAKDLDKLFDRYYRVEGHQMKTIAGFGIGLYLCSEIIERHNGKIWVDSTVGVGSTFYFSIPVID